MTPVNENTKTIRDLAAYVCDRLVGKVLIHRYDAYSTNSVYLKFDYGVANSLRIADHAGKEYLSYRFNIILTLAEPEERPVRPLPPELLPAGHGRPGDRRYSGRRRSEARQVSGL